MNINYVEKIYVVRSLDDDIILVTDSYCQVEELLIEGAKNSENERFFCSISILKPIECDSFNIIANNEDYEYGITRIEEDVYSGTFSVKIWKDSYLCSDYNDFVEGLRSLQDNYEYNEVTEDLERALNVHSEYWETSHIPMRYPSLAIRISSSILYKLLESGFHSANLIVSVYEDESHYD